MSEAPQKDPTPESATPVSPSAPGALGSAGPELPLPPRSGAEPPAPLGSGPERPTSLGSAQEPPTSLGPAQEPSTTRRSARDLSTAADRFTAWLAHGIVDHPRAVVLVASVLTLAALVLAGARLRIDTDRNKLIGEDLKYNQNYMQLEREFGDLAAMTVVVEAPNRDRAREIAAHIAARCERENEAERSAARAAKRPELDVFGKVFYRVPLDALKDRTLLFAELGDLRELASTLENTQLFARLAHGEATGGVFEGLASHVRRKVATGDASEPGGGADMGGILFAVLDGIASALEGTPYRTPWKDVVDDGYGWLKPAAQVSAISRYGPKGQRLAVLVPPIAHEGEMDGSTESVHRLRAILDECRHDPRWGDVHLGLTGSPVLAVDEMETYRGDATVATLVGFAAVILLFMISFRRVLGPLCAGVCLAMAIALTLAFATIWPGHLNLISIVFLEILIGLGIDFGIHLISRYDEERTYGMAPAPALEAALGLTGRASAAGAVTTALAFMATLLADFKGIQEFGVIAAVGIFCCLATMLVVLPALIVLADRGAGGLKRRPRPGWARTRGAVALDRWAMNEPVALVLLGLVLAGAGLFVGERRLRYSGNLLELQATSLESVQLATDLVEGDTVANVILGSSAELETVVAKLRKIPEVVDRIDGPPTLQDEKLAVIARIASCCRAVPLDGPFTAQPVGAPSLEQARGALARLVRGLTAFGDALDEAKEHAVGAGRADDVKGIESIQVRLDALAKTADPEGADALRRGTNLLTYESPLRAELLNLMLSLRSESLNARKVTPAELPEIMRERFVSKDGKKLVIHIHPKQAIFDDAPLERFVTALRAAVEDKDRPDGLAVTGAPIQIYETGRRMKEGYERAGVFALVFIAIYLVLHFRSFAYAGITIAALLAGAAIGVGLLGLKGETLNPANMLAIPLTLGIGVCYSIQLVHRHRQAAALPSVAGAQPVIATSTGRGVILSAGTNVVGFGALAIAHHHGTASIGYAITFGVLGCLVTALLLLPAMLRLWTGKVEPMTLTGLPGPKIGPEGRVARPETASFPKGPLAPAPGGPVGA